MELLEFNNQGWSTAIFDAHAPLITGEPINKDVWAEEHGLCTLCARPLKECVWLKTVTPFEGSVVSEKEVKRRAIDKKTGKRTYMVYRMEYCPMYIAGEEGVEDSE